MQGTTSAEYSFQMVPVPWWKEFGVMVHTSDHCAEIALVSIVHSFFYQQAHYVDRKNDLPPSFCNEIWVQGNSDQLQTQQADILIYTIHTGYTPLMGPPQLNHSSLSMHTEICMYFRSY